MDLTELIRSKKQHLNRLANRHRSDGEKGALALLTNCVPKPTGLGMKTLLNALVDSSVRIKASSFDGLMLPDASAPNFTDPVAYARSCRA